MSQFHELEKVLALLENKERRQLEALAATQKQLAELRKVLSK